MKLFNFCVRNTFAVLACAMTAPLLQTASADTATTDPVGFVTMNISGTGGTTPKKISFKSLGLTQPVVYQGSAETVSVGNKTLTDNEATWTADQFNGANGLYYVEIVRPAGQQTAAPGEGTTYDIASTSAKTLTTVQALASNLVNGAVFKIRKHWTIASVFGAANTAGLGSGDDSSTADQVQIWTNNGVGAGFASYYYQVAPGFAGGEGWRSAGNVFADAGATPIYPDDGLVITRINSANVNVVVMGAVKTGQTSVPIQSGVNILSNVYAAPMTLASSGLQGSGIATGDDSTTADQVQIWNGTGYSSYYYQIAPTFAGGNGWRSAGNVFDDAGSTPIPVGSSIVIRHTFGSAFNWVAPQHPTSL